jgi:hypothetical protein
MKYLAWFSGIFVTLLIGIYVIAFTGFGNSLLKPIIESKINETTKLSSKLSTFSLSMSDFSIVLELDSDNSISANGNYSLFSQAFDVAYRVDMNKLESLKELTNAPLQGAFKTKGTAKGDLALINIDGSSDVAKSDTSYHVELKDFNPTSIIAKINKADLASLLYLGGQKAYAGAELNLDIDFKNITPHQLDGTVLLTTDKGKIDTKLMQNDFNLTLPATAFAMNLDATLQGDDVNYKYILNSNLAKITSDGKVTPEPLQTDIRYSVDIKELAVLKPITNAPLRGAFKTDGKVVGTKESMKIAGKSDLGGSDTTYNVDLKEFQPLSVIASIKGAKLEKLLYMGGQENFASSDLDVDVKLTSLDPKNLAGYLDIALENGLLNSKVMKKSFDVSVPKTKFDSKTHVDLKGKDVDYTMAFNSNLAKLNSNGHLVPDTMAMDLKYGVNVKELAVLKPITGADIRGSLNLKGTLKGDKKKLVVNGASDFASSDTSFEAILKDFAPASVKAKMKNLQLAKVLYMVKQPHYADGTFNLDVDIPDARVGKLKGKVVSKITHGLVDSKYITKAYKFKTQMPKTTFTSTTTTVLDKNVADTKVNFKSTLADFDIKQARFNLEDSSLVSDYKTKIHSLKRLYFVTDRKMKGSISVNGKLKKGKDLDLSIYSNIADGKIDAKLHNDDFHADITSMQTLKILEMIVYPEIFKSTLNAKLDYNLLREKGTFKGQLVDGKFTKNQMLSLVKQYTKVDLYKENFKGDVNANINKEKIVASMDLKSRTASIKTKNTKLDSKKQTINSKIDIVANKHPLTITLKGNVNSPKYGVEIKGLLKEKAKDAVEKNAKKLFKKFF